MKNLLLCCLLSLAACTSEVSVNNKKSPSKDAETKSTDSAQPDQKKTVVDLSTSLKAAESFIAAAVAKDMDALAECLDENCEGEFKPLLNKTAKNALLDELKEMFTGASGEEGAFSTDNQRGEIKISKGGKQFETFKMRRRGKTWKLVGF